MGEELGQIYGKLNKLDNRLTKLEGEQPFIKDVLERETQSNEKLADALHKIEISMSKIDGKLDRQSEVITTMKKEFEETSRETNDKIAKVDAEVKTIRENSKFDILEFAKKNFPWIIVLFGLGVSYVSKFVKF